MKIREVLICHYENIFFVTLRNLHCFIHREAKSLIFSIVPYVKYVETTL